MTLNNQKIKCENEEEAIKLLMLFRKKGYGMVKGLKPWELCKAPFPIVFGISNRKHGVQICSEDGIPFKEFMKK